MKKIILGLAATALIFASCSKDETTSVNDPGNPNVIGFEAGTGKVIGRASSNNIGVLEGSADGFGVYATYKTAGVEFIANKAYFYNAGAWKWKNDSFNWPDAVDYPVNFYAYYPQAGTSLTTSLTASYTVADAVGSQVDYLAAQKTGVTVRPGNSKVALDFKHIMSKVDFKVSAGAGATVMVQSIEVKQVGNTRTFNYGTMAWGTAPTAFGSSYEYMTAANPAPTFINTFINSGTAASDPAEDVAPAAGSIILMPQDLSSRGWSATAAPVAAADSYIEVVYRIIETNGGADIVGMTDATQHLDYGTLGNGETGPLFVKVGYGLPTDWEKNKAYTYVLHLGDPDYSGGNLTDDTFIDVDGNDTNLPVVDPGTGEDKNIPDEIFDDSDLIGFTVDVSDWDDANGIDL